MDKPIFVPGQIIKHFKREYASVQEQRENKHLYKVIAIALNTETEEEMLIYQALYRPFMTFCRPLKMCIDLVDKSQHLLISQKYRLEPWEEEESIYGSRNI